MSKKVVLVLFIYAFLAWIVYSQFIAKKSEVNIVAPRLLNEDLLFELIQNWRTTHGLTKYQKSVVTCGIANLRVKEIQTNNSHEGYLEKAKQWLDLYGLDKIGENLADDYINEEITINEWSKSPAHLRNLEDSFAYSCIRCESNKCVHIFATR